MTFVDYLELVCDICGLFGLSHDPTWDVKLGCEPYGLLSRNCDPFWATVTFTFSLL